VGWANELLRLRVGSNHFE
jgi:hypothetical protein